MKRMLAGEDARRSRRVHEHAPSPLGRGVAVASDRNEGVAAAQSRALDRIIAAPDMPAMDGIGFLHALRQTSLDPMAPIVMLAAQSDKGLKPQAKTAGPSRGFDEPFKPESLIAANRKAPQ